MQCKLHLINFQITLSFSLLSKSECSWGDLNEGIICIDTKTCIYPDSGGGSPLSIPGAQFEQIGIAFGPAFYGFTLAMIIGGFMVDLFGMRKIMNLAFAGHLVGIVLTLFARDFWMLFSGTLLIGIGNGMVEAACNPLIATLYPKEKTKML